MLILFSINLVKFNKILFQLKLLCGQIKTKGAPENVPGKVSCRTPLYVAAYTRQPSKALNKLVPMINS